jgi:hypothetical protein
MAILVIEYFTDGATLSNVNESIYGELISSTEDTSLTTSVESSVKPGGSTYCSIYTDTACYVEIGPSTQDVTSGRRIFIDAGERRDFSLKVTDTHISYRTVV